VIGLGLEDRLIRGQCRVEVARVEVLARRGEFGIDDLALLRSAAFQLAGGGLQQRVDPAAQLLGRLCALEAGQRLSRRQRDDGRHALRAERLRDLRHDVDVDRGERPLAAVGGGECREHLGELHAGRAARRPQQHHHGYLVGPGENLGFEVRLGDL
jgi:hypothetical protein